MNAVPDVADAERRDRQRQRERRDAERGSVDLALRRLASVVMSRRRTRAANADASESGGTRLSDAIGRVVGARVRPCRPRTRRMTPVMAIAKAAELRYRRVSLTGDWATTGSEPLLVFRGNDLAPAALLPRRFRRSGYDLYAERETVAPLDGQTAAELSPFGFMFYRTFPRAALSIRDLVWFGLTGGTRDWLTIAGVSLASALTALVAPLVIGAVFDSAIPRGRHGDVLMLGAILIVAAVASALFTLAHELVVLRLQGRLSLAFDAALWDRLLSLPLPFFRQYASGDLAQRGLAFSRMRTMMTTAALTAIVAGMSGACSFGLLLYYSPRLSLLALATTAVALLVTVLVTRRQVGLQRSVSAKGGRITGMLFELITGIAKFRLAGAELRAFALWAREFAAQKAADLDLRRLDAGLTAFNAVYLPACTAIFYFAYAGTPEQGPSIGGFLAFIMAFGQFTSSSLAIGDAIVSAGAGLAQYERVSPILRTVPEPSARDADIELQGEIEVHRLAFRYRPDAPRVLRDVSFHIRPGQYVALVGPSGCGKSTLFRLLLGFNDLRSGWIAYDGTDTSDLDMHVVRMQIGVVLQSGRLLGGTIKDNICGMARLPMHEVWEAAQLVGLEDEIRAMPMGMHTIVSGSGAGLSGGQRQRLLIARAIARQPRVLLFDEPTSALDNRTQAVISGRLKALHATRLVIAHRLTTILDADRILVMDGGRIVQAGTYDALMSEPGLFRQLAERQVI